MKRIAVLLAVLLLRIPTVGATAAESESPRHVSALAEAQSGMLIGGTDADKQVPAGTQTKLMTVLLTAEAVEDGRLTPDTLIAAPAAAERYPGATCSSCRE